MNDHQVMLWAIIKFACTNGQIARMEKAASDFQECAEGRCGKVWCRQAVPHSTLAEIALNGDRI